MEVTPPNYDLNKNFRGISGRCDFFFLTHSKTILKNTKHPLAKQTLYSQALLKTDFFNFQICNPHEAI